MQLFLHIEERDKIIKKYDKKIEILKHGMVKENL